LQCSDCVSAGTQYCTSNNGLFQCVCNTGYSGEKCEVAPVATTVAPLQCSDCQAIGTEFCQVVNGLFQCKCKTGYSGVKCETASATVPPTTPKAFSCSDCLAPGTEYCAFINNAMSCKCKQGYSGPKCGIFISTTITTPAALKCSDCSTVGTEYCSLVNGAFQCKCKTGFIGKLCKIPQTTIAPSTTKAAMTCSDCKAPGTEYCTMINSAITCKCKAGYTGSQCETYEVTTPAPLKCTDCSNIGTNYCAFENNVYKCKCKQGYQGDKCDSSIVSTTAPTTTIAPVTKCTDCVTAGTAYCSFVNGQFSCSCKSGYSGATCNIMGVTTVTTPAPTTPKKNCTFCSTEGTQSCVIHATYQVWCQCKVGYFGLTCNQSFSVMSTTSQPATTQLATTASNITPTSCGQCSQPNTAACAMPPGCPVGSTCPVTCTCKPGWKGATCSQDINECTEGKNSGPDPVGICNSVPGWTQKCVNLVGSFKCICSKGVTGEKCTADLNECIEEQPCVQANTVNCYNLWGSYTCICKDGFTGTNCENRISGGIKSGWLLSFL